MFRQFELGENGLRRVLGSLELSIMEAVWADDQPVTIRDICDRVAGSGEAPAFTTVMTVMNRLAEKGLLVRTGTRKRYLFRATNGRQALEDRVSQQVVTELLTDYGPMAINHFVEAVSVDPAKMALLESLLGKLQAQKGEKKDI